MPRTRTFFLVTLPVLVGHLFLPLTLLPPMRKASGEGTMAWLPALAMAAGYFAFIGIAGAWSWFGRIVRGVLPVLLVVTAWWSFPREEAPAPWSASFTYESGLRLTLGALFLAMAVIALRGRSLHQPALDLAFPLRGGTFQVGQGGASRLVNYHFAHSSQRYALDIVMLNGAGVRARGVYPRAPERYAIWGAEVVSPCEGVVAAVVDGLADHSPPDRDPVNRAGNHVAIESGGATVYLAHLMRGSVAVRAGDTVRAGQLLGRVGNSGNTTEPHLHIHAERGAYPGRFSGMPGIPVRFGGRFLVRNDRVRSA